jgi:hypothetical protein
VSGQKVHPRDRHCLVIETSEAMVFGERLNSAANASESGFKWLSREMQPRQPQVIAMAKVGSGEAAGVEGLQEFVVVQVSRGKHKRHKPIMAD